MKIDNRLVSIQYPDKTVSRLKRPEAARLVEAGKAQYVSKSIYRSLTQTDKPSDEPSELKPRQERESRHDKKKRKKKSRQSDSKEKAKTETGSSST